MSKGEKTKTRIIVKAAPLFNKKGFEGCSMQEISAATGLEKGSLYSHFETKEELAVEAFDYAWSETCKARIGNLSEVSNSVEKLKLHIENAVTKPPFPGGCPMLNTAMDTDDGNPALRRRSQEALKGWVLFLKDVIETGQGKGEIRSSVDAESLATLILSLLEGAFVVTRLQRSEAAMLMARQHLYEYLENQVRA